MIKKREGSKRFSDANRMYPQERTAPPLTGANMDAELRVSTPLVKPEKREDQWRQNDKKESIERPYHGATTFLFLHRSFQKMYADVFRRFVVLLLVSCY